MSEFSDRRGAILRIIVAEYIASGVPVASEAIARSYSLGISPATIRHEMARLEEDGYIARLHTSSGGVPLDKGYRYHVESLIKESKLARADRVAIRRFFDKAEQEPEEWARLAVHVLTQRLESVALATSPRSPMCHFRHVDLVALQELLVLLVLVLQEGVVKKRILAAGRATSQDELTVTANKMNAAYQGLNQRQMSEQCMELTPVEEQISDCLVRVMETEDSQQYGQFYLDGLRHLLSQTEFMGRKKILDLVEAIEDRKMLGNLLGSLGGASGVRIAIGNENEESALHEFSVILCDYGFDERRGAIAVIGPTRMPYSRAIPTVDYVSTVMSNLLSRMPA